MMNRTIALGIGILILLMVACLPFFARPDSPDVREPTSGQDIPDAPESARATESIPTAEMKITATRGGHQSREYFGECINHYHRELRFAPWDTDITVKEGIVWGQLGSGFAGNSQEWLATLPVALCLDYAPTPSRDELSAKCVIETAEWYLREYPDIEYAVGPFALVSCLPPYEG